MTHHPPVVGPPLLPAEVGREEARELARRELAERIYHRDDPSLVERLLTWFIEQLGRVSEQGADLAPGGWSGLFAIAVLFVLLVVAIRLRVGPMRRDHAATRAALTGSMLTPEEHRTAAERAATSGHWAEAVRERLRAIARDLEERVVIDPNPGRTADELAAEAGAALPTYSDDLLAAARTFDDIWYGSRPASPEAYERLRRLDEELRTARAVTAGAARPGEPGGREVAAAGHRP